MARALWNGSISFGMVNIAVKVYGATRDRDIRFHQLCSRDKSRIHQKLVCEAGHEGVSRDEILKGYEVSTDHYVVFDNEEIDKLRLEKDPNIEITNFVDLADVDPMYFEKPYYLMPKKGSVKAYKLLVEAMHNSNRIGVGRFVMHGKEYLAALRITNGIICLETMRFADEIVDSGEMTMPAEKGKIDKNELAIAKQLIDALFSKFEPKQFKNEFHDRVQAAIEAKSKGHKVVVAPQAKETEKVANLMAALKKSLEQTKRTRAKKTA